MPSKTENSKKVKKSDNQIQLSSEVVVLRFNSDDTLLAGVYLSTIIFKRNITHTHIIKPL